MFIAHAPAGYLLATWRRANASKSIVLCAVIASLLPDIDLLYFYLIDNQQTHHHHYWFHIPFFWVCLFLFAYVICRSQCRNALTYITISFYCLMLHMALDSIVAPILWLAPLDNTAFQLHHITPQYDWWVWNFILHWSFAAEIIICILAWRQFTNRRTTASHRSLSA